MLVKNETSMEGVELGKEAKTEEKAAEEKDVLMHKTEISVASTPVQEQKEEALSMPRKHKRELEYLQPGVKYQKMYHTKKAKAEEAGEKKRKKE